MSIIKTSLVLRVWTQLSVYIKSALQMHNKIINCASWERKFLTRAVHSGDNWACTHQATAYLAQIWPEYIHNYAPYVSGTWILPEPGPNTRAAVTFSQQLHYSGWIVARYRRPSPNGARIEPDLPERDPNGPHYSPKFCALWVYLNGIMRH